MKRFISKALFVSSLVIFATPIIAGDSTSSSFKALDRDNDGYISINEASERLDLLRQWVNVDKNTDGQLEMTEFSAFEIEPAGTFQPVEDDDTPEPGAAPTK